MYIVPGRLATFGPMKRQRWDSHSESLLSFCRYHQSIHHPVGTGHSREVRFVTTTSTTIISSDLPRHSTTFDTQKAAKTTKTLQKKKPTKKKTSSLVIRFPALLEFVSHQCVCALSRSMSIEPWSSISDSATGLAAFTVYVTLHRGLLRYQLDLREIFDQQRSCCSLNQTALRTLL